MRSSVRIAVSALVAGAAVAYAAPAYASTVTQLPVSSTGFFGGFNDVTAVSATDGWAVGGNGNGIVQRYNGTRWSSVTSPDLLTGGNTWAMLSGVDSVSSSSAFAVGRTTGSAGSAAVALRWNGSAWSRLTVSRPAGTNTSFTSVKAFSANDAWAVGTTSTSSVAATLAMHYNGSGWSGTPTPSPGTRNNWVTAVDGIAANDVWAVGYSLNLPYGNRIRQSMILHWNGTAWSQPSSPNNGSTFLYDVAPVSRTDAWAVGSSSAGALVARWNGTTWSAVAAPSLSTLQSVAARSSSDVWVAGADAAGAPAVAHWNGSSWSVTSVTVTGGVGAPGLTAVAAADATTELAVGYQADGTTGQSASIAFRVAG
ncbi:MAG TPA: hypothetical protein VH502_15140 [Actinoplanes sp.]